MKRITVASIVAFILLVVGTPMAFGGLSKPPDDGEYHPTDDAGAGPGNNPTGSECQKLTFQTLAQSGANSVVKFKVTHLNGGTFISQEHAPDDPPLVLVCEWVHIEVIVVNQDPGKTTFVHTTWRDP